jgi:hypothetical protein
MQPETIDIFDRIFTFDVGFRMSDQQTFEDILADMRHHWAAGRFAEVAIRIGRSLDLCQIDPSVTIRLTLSASDVAVLHGSMYLALHFRQDEEGGDSEEQTGPNSSPNLTPSLN